MPAIICTGAAGTGTETHLSEKSFQRGIESFIGQGFPDQCFLHFRAAPWSWRTGSHGETHLTDHVIPTLQPDSKIDNGQRHSLRAHDTLEAGSLSLFGQWKIKANEQ